MSATGYGKGSDQRPMTELIKKLLKIIGIGYSAKEKPKKMLKKTSQLKSNWVYVWSIHGYTYGQ